MACECTDCPFETERDLLREQLGESRQELNKLRLQYGEVKDAVEGLVLDMSLMEDLIAQLSGTWGKDPFDAD